MFSSKIAIGVLVLGLAMATPSQAQDQEVRIRALELRSAEAREESRALSARAAEAERQSLALEADLTRLQAERDQAARDLALAETQLAAAEDERDRLEHALNAQHDSLEQVTRALTRLSRADPPALAVHSQDAVNAARAALLLTRTVDALEARAAAIRADIAALSGARQTVVERTEQLQHARAALAARDAELQTALEQSKTNAQRWRAGAQVRAEDADRLAAEAAGLRRVLEQIAAERAAARAVAPSASAAEAFARIAVAPTTGPIAIPFGERRVERQQTGVSYFVKSGGDVVAVADAVVAYDGPLRGYGEILILELAPEYYVVLAGLGRSYVQTGQAVLAGEPIGAMPVSGDERQELYVELRHTSTPINPTPWFTAVSRPNAAEDPA